MLFALNTQPRNSYNHTRSNLIRRGTKIPWPHTVIYHKHPPAFMNPHCFYH